MFRIVKELHLVSPFNNERWIKLSVDNDKKFWVEFPWGEKNLVARLEPQAFGALCKRIKNRSCTVGKETLLADNGLPPATIVYKADTCGVTFDIRMRFTEGMTCPFTWEDLDQVPDLLLLAQPVKVEAQPVFGL